MDHHPYSEYWPLMSGSAFDDFATDIAAHGLVNPILTYQGLILDGRNRERACLEAGVEPRYEEARVTSDKQALALIVSLNQHRRHLTLQEKAFAAAKYANRKHGSNRFETKQKVEPSNEASTFPVYSIAEAASKMGVSSSTVEDAKIILKDGTPDEVKAVLENKIGLRKKATELRAKAKSKQPPRKGKRQRGANVRMIFPNLADGHTPLTQEQIDPEFTGTPIEWTDKYGHVQMETAQQRASGRFGDWARKMNAFAKDTDWPEVDLDWLRDPSGYDVNKLSRALEILRPRMAQAEALLAKAKAKATAAA